MKELNRRQFAKLLGTGVVSVPLAGLIAQLPSHADELPMVDPAAENAVALKYMAESTKDGQTCAGCSLFQGTPGDMKGPCPLFPNAVVGANSWCSAFVPRS